MQGTIVYHHPDTKAIACQPLKDFPPDLIRYVTHSSRHFPYMQGVQNYTNFSVTTVGYKDRLKRMEGTWRNRSLPTFAPACFKLNYYISRRKQWTERARNHTTIGRNHVYYTLISTFTQ